MGTLQLVLTGLFIATAIIMVFFILLQEGKGGGLAGLGGTKAAGVEGVTNPIRRATGILAALFFVLAIILGILARPEGHLTGEGLFSKTATETAKPEPEPAAPPENAPPLPPLPPAANAAAGNQPGTITLGPGESLRLGGNEPAPRANEPRSNAPQANAPKASP